MICHQPVSFQHVLFVFQNEQHLSSGFFFVFINPIAACIINNETLLSELFTTHTDIVSVWWIN